VRGGAATPRRDGNHYLSAFEEVLMRNWFSGRTLALWGAIVAAGAAFAGGPPKVTPEEIAARIKQTKAGEVMGWARIPWVASLTDARRLSQEEHVPVFLFTLDGNLAAGRC
jgi:hypothetical protein